MKKILSAFLLFGLLIVGCKASSIMIRLEDQNKQLWIGYPVESLYWEYRYVFDSPDMESGWVEYQAEEEWFVSGELKGINRSGNTIMCKGPIGTNEDIFYIGFIFEVLHTAEGNSLVQMTCDAFDSRLIILLFRKEIHNNIVIPDSSQTIDC